MTLSEVGVLHQERGRCCQLDVQLDGLRAELAAAVEQRRVEASLLDVALQTGDAGAVLARLAEMVGSPAVLQDRTMSVVASAAAAGPAAPNRAGLAPADLLLQPARCRVTDETVRQAADRGQPALLPGAGRRPARVVTPVVAAGEVLGFLTVAGPAVEARLAAAVSQAAAVLGLQLLARERISEAVSRDRHEFFADLVASRGPESLAVSGRRLGHDLDAAHIPIAFGFEGGSRHPERDLPTLVAVVRDVLDAGRDRGGPAPVIGIHDGCVVAFVPGAEPERAAGITERVRRRVGERRLRVVAGWGPICAGAASFGLGLAKARWVIDVLPAVAAPCAGFEDLGIYSLLFDKADSDQLGGFVDRWLGPLLDYDRTHPGQFTGVLRTFLEAGSTAAAASQLYVHVSTLKYRIRKIESLLGLNLADPTVQFNLRLALKILETRERLGQSGRGGDHQRKVRV